MWVRVAPAAFSLVTAPTAPPHSVRMTGKVSSSFFSSGSRSRALTRMQRDGSIGLKPGISSAIGFQHRPSTVDSAMPSRKP